MPKIWGLVEYPVRSKDDFEKLRAEYRARQERNIANNIIASYMLDIQSPSLFSFLPAPFYQVHLAEERLDAGNNPRIANLGSYRPRSIDLSATLMTEIKVTLVEPINIGAPLLSQLWKAYAENGVPVAVKFYQSCFGTEPEWISEVDSSGNRSGGRMVEFLPEEESAHREAWAYSALQEFQGLTIPHSYGFYDVKVPSGDIVCAHIMEYFEGENLCNFSKRARRLNLNIDRDYMMNRVAGSFFGLLQCGVLHGDINARNVLCPKRRPEDCILIDFGMAKSLSDPQVDKSFEFALTTCDVSFLLTDIDSRTNALKWLERRAAESKDNREWFRFLLSAYGKPGDEWKPVTQRAWERALHKDRHREEMEKNEKPTAVENKLNKPNYYHRSDWNGW